MSVYVVVDNEVHQPEEYAKYLELITPTVAEYGGEYVIRAGEILLADSDWQPDRLVVMAFPDAKSAKAWVCLLYTSPSPRDQLTSRMPSSA